MAHLCAGEGHHCVLLNDDELPQSQFCFGSGHLDNACLPGLLLVTFVCVHRHSAETFGQSQTDRALLVQYKRMVIKCDWVKLWRESTPGVTATTSGQQV